MDQNKATSSSSQIAVQKTTAYAGPLPPPEMLEKFERIQPGFAERIFVMPEAQHKHRHEIERKALEAQIAEVTTLRVESQRGQYFGFLIAITALICGAAVAIWAEGWSGALFGSILGLGGVGSIVSVFVLGQRKRTGLPDTMDQNQKSKV
ncbi:MAG: DUF2335 domain-containing protein [Planctomycetes bacterium]|nr:DUF2335 domain-containing protein [Planctomycetota bacterium]NUQ34601.1 DUF2335 domain-containing protein [Planctomycetaceae bacterium]